MNKKEMLDKDKKIIIAYIGIKDLDEHDVPSYLQTIIDKLSFDDSVKLIAVPTIKNNGLKFKSL